LGQRSRPRLLSYLFGGGEAEVLVAGTTPVHEATFKVRAVAFPAGEWYKFRKVFKPRRTSRTMRDRGGPLWERIDGRGFTIWVSDGCLADSRTVPPTWEVRLESLAPLNTEGQQCWREVCEGIERFIRVSGLERIEAKGTDAEPGSVLSSGDS
jgi:hypothetical protein